MTKGGYVDSSRRIRSLHREQDDLQLSKHHTSRGGLLASINKSSLSAPLPSTSTRKGKALDKNKLTSSSSLSNSANLENKIREYDKQMRVIEVCIY